MIFSPPLCEKVLDGTKTVTRRLTKGEPCTYRVGQDYAVQEQREGNAGRGGPELGRILIVSATQEEYVFSEIYTHFDIEAMSEGLSDFDEFVGCWHSLHPDGRCEDKDTYDEPYEQHPCLNEPVYRIEFELVGSDE